MTLAASPVHTAVGFTQVHTGSITQGVPLQQAILYTVPTRAQAQMEADIGARAPHQRLVCHVLAFAVLPLDTKARRAVVLDDRPLENAVPCAARVVGAAVR